MALVTYQSYDNRHVTLVFEVAISFITKLY